VGSHQDTRNRAEEPCHSLALWQGCSFFT
jgi:hypothetical protein